MIGLINNYINESLAYNSRIRKAIFPRPAHGGMERSRGSRFVNVNRDCASVFISLLLLLSKVTQGQGRTLTRAATRADPAGRDIYHRLKYHITHNEANIANAFPRITRRELLNQNEPDGLPGSFKNVENFYLDDIKMIAEHYNDTDKTGRIKTNISASISLLYHYYEKMYPDILKIAADEMAKAIKKRAGLTLDPNKIYFHHFIEAQNDHHSITGWRHDGSTPVESRTLAECMLSNFPADARDNIDVLDQMAGIYRDRATATSSFGAENEVRIKPSLILSIVSQINFFDLYQSRLEHYWHTEIPEMINFCLLITGLSKIIKENEDKLNFFLKAFSILPDEKEEIRKYIFDINGYLATDLVVLSRKGSAEIALYMPRDDDKLYYFSSAAEMRSWFSDRCADMEKRNTIAAHFTLHQRQDGNFYSGVDHWLAMIATDRDQVFFDKIWTNGNEISGELITQLTSNQYNMACSDADSLIKSNTEVRLDMAMRYFSIANMLIPNPVTPLISLGLDINKMVNGDNEADRRRGVLSLYGDSVNVILMILSGVLDGRLNIPFDEVELLPKIGENKKSIAREIRDRMQKNSDGREQFPLSAASSQVDNPLGRITFGPYIEKSIVDLGIRESTVTLPQLSAADKFGIMHDVEGGCFILINQKIYKVNSIGKPGYYYLGDGQRLGIYFNPHSSKYLHVHLPDQRLALPVMPGRGASPSALPDKMFQVISPRLQKVMADIHYKGVPAADIEGRLIFDKSNKLFMDKTINKKYLKVAQAYYPVQETDNGYIISAVMDNQREKMILRVFFSGSKKGSTLITRREWAKEIFSSSRNSPSHLKLQSHTALRPDETTLLKSLLSAESQSYHESPFRELPEASKPERGMGDWGKLIDGLPPILVKLKAIPCVVRTAAMLDANEFGAINKESLFVIAKIALVPLEPSWVKPPVPEPGYRLVTLEIQLEKNGYPINFPADTAADVKIVIAQKTLFSVKDIFPDRLVLREADKGTLRNDAALDQHIRKLYPGDVETAGGRLRREMINLEKLLQQGSVPTHLSQDLLVEYTDVLSEMVKKAGNVQVIEEFTEAGSDFINNWLRFGIDDVDAGGVRASDAAADMLAEYAQLDEFDKPAYRSATYPAGVYNQKIKAGDSVADRGFMSASALPTNSVEWLNNWTRNVARISGDRVIMIFDKSVRKKIASSDFLIDHLLVQPGTPLKVESIRTVQNIAGENVCLVGVSQGSGADGLKDIYSGIPMFTPTA